MRRYVVYCHTNKINGKKYVGITSQSPKRRWKNGEGYKNNEHFYRAILKYGWHNFYHEILYTNLSALEAEETEKAIIKEFQSNLPNKGYNIQPGGNSGNKFTDESREKISKALKGKPKSEEHKNKIRQAKSGQTASDETKNKLRLAHLGSKNPMFGKKRDISQYKTKSVICVETGDSFISTCEASRKTGIDQSAISRACNGKRKNAGGLHWSFVKD